MKYLPVYIVVGLGAVVAAFLFLRRDDSDGAGFFPGPRLANPYAGSGKAACIGGSFLAGLGPAGAGICDQIGDGLDPLAGPVFKSAGEGAGGIIEQGTGFAGDVISTGRSVFRDGSRVAGNIISAPFKFLKLW